MGLLRSIFAGLSRTFQGNSAKRKIDLSTENDQSEATAKRLILLSRELTKDSLQPSNKNTELFKRALQEALSTVLQRKMRLCSLPLDTEVTLTDIERRFKLSLPTDTKSREIDQCLENELIYFRSLGDILSQMDNDRKLGTFR